MILTLLAMLPVVITSNVAAAQSLSVLCIAGQCVQGISNTTLGVSLSAPGVSTPLHLLPGTYTSTTSPQLLHNALTSSGASLTASPGFENATQAFSPSSLPLRLTVSPGMVVYDSILYSGQAKYSGFPEVVPDAGAAPVQVVAASFVLSDNMYVVLAGPNGTDDRVVLWNSVPDINQLPSTSTSDHLGVLEISLSTCSPSCSSNGICSPSNNSCICAPGFTGTSCESCSPGFFGPKCQACEAGCDQCDDGTSGTGRCLKKSAAEGQQDCECENGQCGSNGQCTCSFGWQDGSDGKKCSTCLDGFFLNSTGDCQACPLGCLECAATTGACVRCNQGFTIDPNNNSQCKPQNQPGNTCPAGTFDNLGCQPCSSACGLCNGGSSNNCLTCAAGTFMLNGNCVSTNANGNCQGSDGADSSIANNVKGKCDACPSKCTSCRVPGFSPASTMDQVQCTGCLSGFVLSQGKCVESCPTGTFLSPQDNLSCIPCDSSCSSCVDSADFCLTCSGSGQLAFGGKCVSSCPSNTFTSDSSTCATCHGDCASCSGSRFDQCTSCPANRPNLKGGRCLPTCAQNEFFDKSSSSCVSCDSSCGTCSSAGSNNCLSCSDGQVLSQGKCVGSEGGCATLKGLGVCLNELAIAPPSDPTGPTAPMPSITGIADPTKVVVENKLQWWHIVLMVLGGLFLLLLVIMLWRRYARKKRAEETKAWATQRGVTGKRWWKRIFARKARGKQGVPMEKEKSLPRYRDEDISEHRGSTVHEFLDAYGDRRSSWGEQGSRSSIGSRSLYSEITGKRRKAPEPRLPVVERSPQVKSLYVTSRAPTRSIRSSKASSRKLVPDPQTEAQRYAKSVRGEISSIETEAREQVGEHPGAAPFIAGEPLSYWVQPTITGTSSQSRNPFQVMMH